jgi:hypothetical protein
MIFYAIRDIFFTSKKCAIKKAKINEIFSILKIDEEYSLKQDASDG